MRARILPLDEITEYGKTDSVALLISITRPEARNILEQLNAWTQDDYLMAEQQRSNPVRLLIGLLDVIAGGNPQPDQFNQDMVNTDGRTGVSPRH